MPGLRRLDDTTFVAAIQATDRAIINPTFLVAFFAPTVLGGIGNVPLNDGLKTRGEVTWPDARPRVKRSARGAGSLGTAVARWPTSGRTPA